MDKYILSIDQGTTSTRAVLINNKGVIVHKAQRPVDCLFPQPGYVEQDADQLYISVAEVMHELFVTSGISPKMVAGIGLTNQRETTIVWDKLTKRPVYNAIVWQSKQTQSLCEERESYSDLIQKKTGLRMNPYFSASKIRYILDHIENGQERASKGELLFGTVDTWIIYCLTNGKSFYSDVTNASRTMLMDISLGDWDKELCSIWDIPMCMLPKIKSNIDDFGSVDLFGSKVKILGVAGDQQAALFGHCCFTKGDSKNTYGTGCFMLMNIGEEPKFSSSGLLTTIAWKIGKDITYAFEGSVFMGGATVQWLRDEAMWIKDSKDSEPYALEVSDTSGVYFVPAFVGLGSPWWDDDCRGAVFGLTRGSNSHHIVRAALESIAYQCKDVIDTMKKEAGLKLNTLRVDGGASANNYLMQFQSDILDVKVSLPPCEEVTALGAGYLAGIGAKLWKSLDDVLCCNGEKKAFVPRMDKAEAKKLYDGWIKAVKAAMSFKN